MQSCKTSALILHRYPYSETSWVVKTLTAEHGRVSFLVKGAKRKKSAFNLKFEPLTQIEVVYRHSHRRDLQFPREASVQNWFRNIRADLESTATAQVMAELVLRSEQSHFAQEEFVLLQKYWQNMDSQLPLAKEVLASFLIDFAELHGIGLQLKSCVQCGEDINHIPADLWPALGGAVCSQCLGNKLPHWGEDFRQLLCKVAHKSANNSAETSRVEAFMLDYLRIHFNKRLDLKSWRWLNELRKDYQ
ncbi:MAG: DNA repair protein RecO [Fibrobacter sp.]|nr:DNA repair protein RecO [Fibrobacter sp.]